MKVHSASHNCDHHQRVDGMNGAVTSCDGSERGTVRRSFDETMITPYILTHMYSCTDLETLEVILRRYKATNFNMRDERHELDSSNKILLTNLSGEFGEAYVPKWTIIG